MGLNQRLKPGPMAYAFGVRPNRPIRFTSSSPCWPRLRSASPTCRRVNVVAPVITAWERIWERNTPQLPMWRGTKRDAIEGVVVDGN